MTHFKKLGWALAGVGLLAVALLVGGSFVVFTQNSDTSENVSFKTYTNSTYGYSFQYPNNWVVEPEKQIVDERNRILSLVSVHDPKSTNTFEVSVDQNEWPLKGEAFKTSSVTVEASAQTAYLFPEGYECQMADPTATDCSFFVIDINHNGLSYDLRAIGGAKDIAPPYTTILSSFHFTPAVSSLEWQFTDKGTDEFLIPHTAVTAVVDGREYPLGTYNAKCQQVSAGEKDIYGEYAAQNELSPRVICWYGGGGYEFGLFNENLVWSLKVAGLDEGDGEHPGGKSAFKTLVEISAAQQSSVSGMSKYTDSDFGFSFWYPSSKQVTKSPPITVVNANGYQDSTWMNGPGTSIAGFVKGSSFTIYEVISPSKSILSSVDAGCCGSDVDKYYFDSSSHTWMQVADGGSSGKGPSGTFPADTSKNTMGGLHIFNGYTRFGIKQIIPLSATHFLVVYASCNDATDNPCEWGNSTLGNVTQFHASVQTIVATDPSVATPVSATEQIKVIQAEKDAYSTGSSVTSTSPQMGSYGVAGFGYSFMYPGTWKIVREGASLRIVDPIDTTISQYYDGTWVTITEVDGTTSKSGDAMRGDTTYSYDTQRASMSYTSTENGSGTLNPVGTTLGGLPIYPGFSRYGEVIIPLPNSKMLKLLSPSGAESFVTALAKTITTDGVYISTEQSQAAYQDELTDHYYLQELCRLRGIKDSSCKN